MKSKNSDSVSNRKFEFWPVTGRSLLWSLLVGFGGGLLFGVLAIYGVCEQIPLIGSIAGSRKVISISVILAVAITLIIARFVFDEIGVLMGFIILSTFGLAIAGACLWFGTHAFHFFCGGLAGAMVTPVTLFPITFGLVAKSHRK